MAIYLTTIDYHWYTVAEVTDMSGYEVFYVETCGSGKHFRRHYIRLDDDDYLPLHYGHCVYPRLKKRRAEEYCAYWTPTETGSTNGT